MGEGLYKVFLIDEDDVWGCSVVIVIAFEEGLIALILRSGTIS